MKHGANGSNGLDLQRLIGQAIEGDVAAFARLYRAYMEPIYRYVLFRVGNEVAAELITEEVFVEAWEALPDYQQRSPGSFPVWLYRMARNLVVDYLYEYRQLPHFEEPLDLETEPVQSVQSQLMACNWPGLDSNMLSSLLEALTELTDLEQDVAILAFIEQLPLPTIAPIVDRSEESCRQIQTRVLRKLIHLLKYQPLDDEER